MKTVILAGGLGQRLKPFTEIIPKPLLPIGESTVLEIQITSLKNHGVDEIFLATNYRSEYITSFIGNGDKYGIPIHISKEVKPLGTCGPVTLLKDKLAEPFMLMNGDILTNLNFSELKDFAQEKQAPLTVVTRHITPPFEFGKVVTDGDYITDVEEKPEFKLEILAGIYVLDPVLFQIIPHDQYYGIDILIKDMLARGLPIARFPTHAYWLDIGCVSDYQTAQEAYKEHFQHLK